MMSEMKFWSIPWSLMTQAPKVDIKKMKQDRGQLSAIRKEIKDNYLSLPKSTRFWVTKKDIDKWVEDNKLRRKLLKGKYYYNKEDLTNLSIIKLWI